MEHSFPNGSWQGWFDTYGRKLLLFARQWATSAAGAEDIVQEAFVRFWRSPYRNDVDAHVQLFAMVRRAGLDQVRAAGRRLAREQSAREDDNLLAWFAPAALENQERDVVLQEALARLPSAQREVVVLKVWGELTFDEIARSVDISPNTAASRYRYALETLRRNLALTPP